VVVSAGKRLVVRNGLEGGRPGFMRLGGMTLGRFIFVFWGKKKVVVFSGAKAGLPVPVIVVQGEQW